MKRLLAATQRPPLARPPEPWPAPLPWRPNVFLQPPKRRHYRPPQSGHPWCEPVCHYASQGQSQQVKKSLSDLCKLRGEANSAHDLKSPQPVVGSEMTEKCILLEKLISTHKTHTPSLSKVGWLNGV